MSGENVGSRQTGAAGKPPFPLPRWARIVAFVGLYVLVVIGLHGMQGSFEALLVLVGLEGASLHGVATVASVFIAVMGLASLLYADGNRRNRGLYLTACGLIGILAAFAVAAVVYAMLRTAAPEFAPTILGQVTTLAATGLSLGMAALVSIVAARRRERISPEAVQAPAEEPPPPTS